MAIKKGNKIKNMFTNENVLGLKEHNSLLQEKEDAVTSLNMTSNVEDPTKTKENIKIINKTKTREKEVAKEDSKKTKVVENDSPIQLTLRPQNRDKKKYVTFYMRESTIALIAEYSGRGAGKDRTGYDKSEFVDLLLVKAINALKFNKEK